MSVLSVDIKEINHILQFINLIRIKLVTESTWSVYPVLYATEESIDIIVDSSRSHSFQEADKVVLKFQRQGYEYIVFGEITSTFEENSRSTTVKLISGQKYLNLRKHMRFDVDLRASLQVQDMEYNANICNISKGGVMIYTQIDLKRDEYVNISIKLDSGENLQATSKIMRRTQDQEGQYIYGACFESLPKGHAEILDAMIGRCERVYLKSLYGLREYIKKESSTYNTKIIIFSQDKDESYDIREALIKLGAENFEVLNALKYYMNFLEEEMPQIIIIDTEEIGDEVEGIFASIQQTGKATKLILVLPIEYAQKNDIDSNIIDNMIVLFKPLIYNEFEESIIKYL